jgi:hypothetical protein
VQLLAKELGMEVVLPLQFTPDTSEAQLDAASSRRVPVPSTRGRASSTCRWSRATGALH